MRGPSFDIDLHRRTMTVFRTDGNAVEVRLPDGVLEFETNVACSAGTTTGR
jgi:hypothetical protein